MKKKIQKNARLMNENNNDERLEFEVLSKQTIKHLEDPQRTNRRICWSYSLLGYAVFIS